MADVIELKHPLVQHHLLKLRDKHTDSETFRAQVRRLTLLLTFAATKDLDTEAATVETPLTTAEGETLNQRIGLVPILRAGLGMVDDVLSLIPEAEVWHLGCYRDETTLEPVEYYRKFDKSPPVDLALVLDPMLATGGSAVAALNSVRDWGVKHTKLLAIIAAPEGIERVRTAYPDTDIYVCSIDSHLNEQAYIVPGLGDAGDRIFNAQAI